ncbi:DUF4974 domain-containing protein [Puteibacter caeruleilacunae]|nr:DUF4974 domain-containing protein [Puteibacter caeruleilacunae]
MTMKISHLNDIPEEIKSSIIHYLKGNYSDCNAVELAAWLSEDTSHEKLFEQFVHLKSGDEILLAEKRFDPEIGWDEFKRRQRGRNSLKPRSIGVLQIMRYAAIFIIALCCGGYGMYLLHDLQAETSTRMVEYKIPYGSTSELTLADGTVVEINSGTSIKYNEGFGKSNRDIDLSGEAFFRVAKNEELPFEVHAKNITVRAVGTAFNVKAYTEDYTVKTILSEGIVDVIDVRSSKVRLKPNQMALFDERNSTLQVSDVNAEKAIAWRSGQWEVHNMNLEELVCVLARKFDVKFTFKDEEIKHMKFGGTIRGNDLKQILNVISATAPIDYKIDDNDIAFSISHDRLSDFNLLQ